MFTETDSPNNLMCLYVLFIYLVGLHLQSRHIFLWFSIAELCHSWSVLSVQVVPNNCFQGRPSSLCWLGHLCILTSIGSAVSPRPFLSSLGASAKRVPVPSITAVPSTKYLAWCYIQGAQNTHTYSQKRKNAGNSKQHGPKPQETSLISQCIPWTDFLFESGGKYRRSKTSGDQCFHFKLLV